MFSIPERLPTPAPALEPGPVGRRDRTAALSLSWQGPGRAGAEPVQGKPAEAVKESLGCRPPPPPGDRAGSAGVLEARKGVRGRDCLCGPSGSGRGTGPGEVASLKPPERSGSQATAHSAGSAQDSDSGRRGGPRAPVQDPLPRLGIGLSKRKTCSGAFEGIAHPPWAGRGLGLAARPAALRPQRGIRRL